VIVRIGIRPPRVWPARTPRADPPRHQPANLLLENGLAKVKITDFGLGAHGR